MKNNIIYKKEDMPVNLQILKIPKYLYKGNPINNNLQYTHYEYVQ